MYTSTVPFTNCSEMELNSNLTDLKSGADYLKMLSFEAHQLEQFGFPVVDFSRNAKELMLFLCPCMGNGTETEWSNYCSN